MNIIETLVGNARRHPERIAVIDGRGRRTSYAELVNHAASLAATWREAGIRRGDRVLLAVRVDADLYASLAALWSIGATAVFPEPALGLKGLRTAIDIATPDAFVTNGVYRVLPLISSAVRRIPTRLGTRTTYGIAALEIADVDPDHHALISFTTGSTGRPKAIARSHGFLEAQNRAVSPLLATPSPSTDLVGFPVFVVAALGRGDTSLLPNWRASDPGRADPDAIADHCRRNGVSRLLVNPTIAERMTRTRPPKGLHTLFVGGGPVFPDLVTRLIEWSPGLLVVPVYGSTEAEPIAHHEIWGMNPDQDEDHVGLVAGHVADGTRMRIVDDEIQVAGAHVVRGYLDPANDVETKIMDAEGTVWHRTGDAGRIDGRGRLRLLGRHGSRIEGLWPFPVETQARRWPGVTRAALIAMDGRAALAVEGDGRHHPEWTSRFRSLGGSEVLHVRSMPLDARHGSKIDMAALRRTLES